MDCVAEKLVKATPLQGKSRKSVSSAAGRSPFGDITNNNGLSPNRFPTIPQVTCPLLDFFGCV